MKNRLAIITTHPIQYYAPYFKLLTDRGNIDVTVFYTWGEDVLKDKYDPGFQKTVSWDIPLLDGYRYAFVKNVARDKGSHHFWGINCPTLIHEIMEWGPTAIMVIGWSYYAHLRVISHFYGKIPVVFRGDSTLLDEIPGFSAKKVVRKNILSWIYRHVDIALFVGKNNKNYYEKFGLDDKHLIYAPHAIDNSRFSDDDGEYTSQAKSWRKKLGISNDAIVMLFAGKFENKKNPKILIDVLSSLNVPNLHLVLVGNGPLEQELKQLASANAHIHFIDFQNQSLMPAIYRIGDIFILPSQGPDETWGLAINEAMACGLPVIASDKCGGAVDLIENGKNGYIFESQNTNQLATILDGMLKKTHVVKAMAEESSRKIESFTFDIIAQKIEQVVLAFGKA